MADIVAEGNKTTSSSSTRPLPRKSRRSAARIVVPIVILILLVGGYFLWKHFNAYESTDDAQIDGHINAISARINGNVIQVLTDDEKYVKAGDVLVRIDPRTTRSRWPRRKPIWPTPRRRCKAPASIYPSPPPIRPVN
jgi:membrane fusion protein (multidrug efflux system)